MAVTNLHKPQKNHADRVARFALDAVMAAQATLIDESDPQRGTIRLRVGFHSGPVVANVVGTKNPRCE
jgi:class 3 adenylate cyclase